MNRMKKVFVVALSALTLGGLASGTASAATAAPASSTIRDHSKEVQAKVACGHVTGTLQWGGEASVLVPAYLSFDGKLYNYCHGAVLYVYLKYHLFTSEHNENIGSSKYNRSGHEVKKNHESHWATYGGIELTLCEQYRGWHCGVPVKV